VTVVDPGHSEVFYAQQMALSGAGSFFARRD
jgi:hypothetical protein